MVVCHKKVGHGEEGGVPGGLIGRLSRRRRNIVEEKMGSWKEGEEGEVDEYDMVHDACRPGEDQHTPLRPDNEKDYGGEDEIYPYLVIAIATMPRQYTSWPPM